MQTIDPGKRTERVTVQRIPTTKSATGADIPGDPETVAQTWASILVSKRYNRPEFFTGEKLATRTVYDVEMPYIPNLTEDMVILWEARGVSLNILQIHDQGQRNLSMLILAQEQR